MAQLVGVVAAVIVFVYFVVGLILFSTLFFCNKLRDLTQTAAREILQGIKGPMTTSTITTTALNATTQTE